MFPDVKLVLRCERMLYDSFIGVDGRMAVVPLPEHLYDTAFWPEMYVSPMKMMVDGEDSCEILNHFVEWNSCPYKQNFPLLEKEQVLHVSLKITRIQHSDLQWIFPPMCNGDSWAGSL